jgi:hypothetical protein
MTEQLGLFAGAVEPRQHPRPSEPIIRSADIEGPYRWSMTRAWGAGPRILWNLFNASDADGKRDDPTTLRMMQFSYSWGYGSMTVTNVYPFIASKPKDLHAWRRTFDHKAHEALGMPLWETGIDRGSWSAFLHNQRVISGLITEDTTCVAAWGLGPDPVDLDNFLVGVCMRVQDTEYGCVPIPPTWHCIGTTSDGSPIHPLARGRNRVPEGTELRKWKRP